MDFILAKIEVETADFALYHLYTRAFSVTIKGNSMIEATHDLANKLGREGGYMRGLKETKRV